MQIYLSTKLRAPMWYINCKIYIWCRIKRSECTNKTAYADVSSEIVSCWYHAQVGFVYPWNLRKSDERSTIFLALHFSVRIDPSSHPLGVPITYLPLFSQFSIHWLFSLRFVCSAFSAICHFPLLPSACTPTRRVSRDRRQSLDDFSIFVRCIAMHEVARASEATWDYEMPKSPRLTRVASAGKREATSWDSLATKRRISNYDLLLLASSSRAPSSAFTCTNNVSLKFLRFLSVRFASRMFLHKY